ncbi:MAG TPA: response regulator [Xanthobacteraceae bacterium]|nr:response regulator [Xanthobacteraceae bacterium]
MPKIPLVSIVDDDGFVRESTRGLIRSMGYAAETFVSAEEYLQSNRAADTACLISDIHMPGMNGADLQDRLIAEGHRTPIIFVTAFPDEAIRARVLKAGACGFLTKPFSDESLIECLDKALLNGRIDPASQS